MRFRDTQDVDIIIELTSRMDYVNLKERLRKRHFTHDTTPERRYADGESKTYESTSCR